MKKRFVHAFLVIIIFILFFSCSNSGTIDPSQNTSIIIPENTIIEDNSQLTSDFKNVKAVWLSQYDLSGVYTENGDQRDKEDYLSIIKIILLNIKKDGFNTVFLQTHPNGDSFFPSEISPPSKYVTGGYEKTFDYDPIDLIVKEAKNIGLSIHAWINPLRCMRTDEISMIDDKFLIKKWYTDTKTNGRYVVVYNDKLYLNPAYNEVRELIVSCVKEIISCYNFDGIHLDDYFYPTQDINFDRSAFEAFSELDPRKDLKYFRHNNINMLIKDIYDAVKEKSPSLMFGISPEGNIDNAFNSSYADIYTWCQNKGYIDYIIPQIYFGFEHETCPFDKLYKSWTETVTEKSVRLICGLTLGKAYTQTDEWAGSGALEWKENKDILKRSIKLLQESPICCGISFFSYQHFYDPISGVEVSQTKLERNGFIPLMKSSVWK